MQFPNKILFIHLVPSPATCNFQTGTCGYSGSYWYRRSGATPISNTGPSADYDSGQLNFLIIVYFVLLRVIACNSQKKDIVQLFLQVLGSIPLFGISYI